MKSRDRLDHAIVSALTDADSALYKSCGPAAELVASLAEEVAALRNVVSYYERDRMAVKRSSTATLHAESTETI